MDKEKVWYFGNSLFSVLIKKGSLCSVKHTNDVYDTQYADGKKGFGAVSLCCRNENGELTEFCPNDSDTYEEIPPVMTGNVLHYSGKASNGTVEAETVWNLSGERLEQTVIVRNVGTEPVILTDVGIQQFCHTDFKWGENAAPNVIGHHYVGGHGSHSTYYRVDGEGYCLTFAPMDGTELTWYDCRPSLELNGKAENAGNNVPDKGCTVLYPTAVQRAQRAEEKGARTKTCQKEISLAGQETVEFRFCYFWSENFLNAGKDFVKNDLVYPICVPGYTLPAGWNAQLVLESAWEDVQVQLETGAGCVELIRTEGNRKFYRLCFERLGENTVTVTYGGNRYMNLYYFVTEPVPVLWDKRAAFIADKQVKDENLWYNGLLCEWNNETGVLLSPDNYDRIGGWRIYEVTCDDPGLSKPAFLSTKQTVRPVQQEVTALDDYLEHFVWGGLQRTTEEAYPYGIYGIPDWKQLRDSGRDDTRGTLHIWRIYDYPHIALTYYNMYCVARDHREIKTRLGKEEYLRRAYGTALAMFTIPSEIEDWSAYKTGLYNECVIPDIVQALRECGMKFEADRLHTHWMRKVKFFVTECKDVFGSEYPFDTTGFESTYRLAVDGLKNASYVKDDSPFNDEIPHEKAVSFMEKQHRCNIACRGYLEPVYFGYGSDYRGNNTHYLLSYMSQMGGCSILEHALYYEEDPFEMLRLGYGSLLSSYALMNTGTEESNYGYWFPGKEHDGAAGGGFEPLFEGETWLNQPHHGGSWYYSCEIDLGFCGGVRGASVILADDPLFGHIVYGGSLNETDSSWKVSGADGAGRKFHYVEKKKRFHAVLEQGSFAADCMAVVEKDGSGIVLHFDPESSSKTRKLTIRTKGIGELRMDGAAVETETVIMLEPGKTEVRFEMAQQQR